MRRIDCGARGITWPSPPTGTDTRAAFKTFTADLHRLADWLLACGVTSVAMESTGATGSRLRDPGGPRIDWCSSTRGT